MRIIRGQNTPIILKAPDLLKEADAVNAKLFQNGQIIKEWTETECIEEQLKFPLTQVDTLKLHCGECALDLKFLKDNIVFFVKVIYFEIDHRFNDYKFEADESDIDDSLYDNTPIDVEVEDSIFIRKGYSPFIADDGFWYIYDDELNKFVKTDYTAVYSKEDIINILGYTPLKASDIADKVDRSELEPYAKKSEIHPPYDDTEVKNELKEKANRSELEPYAKKSEIHPPYDDTEVKNLIRAKQDILTTSEKQSIADMHRDAIQDITINRVSVVRDRVVNIPYPDATRAGVVKVDASQNSGMAVGIDGKVFIVTANQTDIDRRTNDKKPITPYNLDYAVKKSLTDNLGYWSDNEKKAARSQLGVNDNGTMIETTLPEPSAEWYGKICIVPSTDNELDRVFICLKKDGEYGWLEFKEGEAPRQPDTSVLGNAIIGTLILGKA